MADFIIRAIEDDFNSLFELDDQGLKAQGAIKLSVDEYPGFPCRVSLEDAPMGEEVLLLPYQHHPTASPYQASGPIFVRKNVQQAKLQTNEVPPILQQRHLSVRCYNKDGFMVDALTCKGDQVKQTLNQLFDNPEIAYIHIHNAKQGCYNCMAERG
jgi:hypothetical protein